jgi:phytoene synthase
MRQGFEVQKISYCAEQVRRGDPDRFLCALFAPLEKREGLLALYAFELELAQVQKKVREPMMGRIRLQWWREAIAELYAGTVRGHQVLQALAAEQLPQKIPLGQLMPLIDAHEAAFEEDPFPTGESLLEYAQAIGGDAMLNAAQFLGDDAAFSYTARSVGTGLGLVKYLQDIPAHAAERRLLLPSDLAGQAEIDPYAMTPGNIERIKIVVALIAEEALRLFDSLRGNDIERFVLPAFMPALFAKHYLNRLAKCDHNLFAPRLNAPNPWKPIQLARAWVTGKV